MPATFLCLPSLRSGAPAAGGGVAGLSARLVAEHSSATKTITDWKRSLMCRNLAEWRAAREKRARSAIGMPAKSRANSADMRRRAVGGCRPPSVDVCEIITLYEGHGSCDNRAGHFLPDGSAT